MQSVDTVQSATTLWYMCKLKMSMVGQHSSYTQHPRSSSYVTFSLEAILPHHQQHTHTHWGVDKVVLLWHNTQLFVSRDSPCVAYHKASDAPSWATGEQEFRALSPEELKACQDGCKPGACKVADLDRQLLQQLYKKGLVHLDVPIRPNDHVSIPPLEVSCLCLLNLFCMFFVCILLRL